MHGASQPHFRLCERMPDSERPAPRRTRHKQSRKVDWRSAAAQSTDGAGTWCDRSSHHRLTRRLCVMGTSLICAIGRIRKELEGRNQHFGLSPCVNVSSGRTLQWTQKSAILSARQRQRKRSVLVCTVNTASYGLSHAPSSGVVLIRRSASPPPPSSWFPLKSVNP